MGFLPDGLQVGPTGFSRPKHRRDSSRPRKKHARSRSRSSSHTRGGAASSIAGALLGGLTGESHSHGHGRHASSASLFGLGNTNTSRSSFFNFGNRSSYYKRSPRQSFMQKTYKRLKRLIRDLVHYAKRYPWKVFFLVVMPLVTTGVLGGLLARFGLRIPPSLERLIGVASRAATGDSIGLVGDAVRFAGDLGGAARAPRSSSWEARRPPVQQRSYHYHRGGYDGYAPRRPVSRPPSSAASYSGYNVYSGSGGYGGYGYDSGWGNAVADMARKLF